MGQACAAGIRVLAALYYVLDLISHGAGASVLDNERRLRGRLEPNR